MSLPAKLGQAIWLWEQQLDDYSDLEEINRPILYS